MTALALHEQETHTSPHLPTPVWYPCGDTGLLLDFGGLKPAFHDVVCAVEDKSVLTQKARRLAEHLLDCCAAGHLQGITDLTPGLTSLLIQYNPIEIRAAQLKQFITPLVSQDIGHRDAKVKIWEIPVCYAEEFAPDLDEISEKTGLTTAQIIALHTGSIHQIAMMGFLPGLGYMTGLPDPLHLPRKANPRTNVIRGSVGIAMDQTVIYPLDSPGGWNLIGRMPYLLFNQQREEPIFFSAGDKVKFISITIQEFDQLAQNANNGAIPSFYLEGEAGS